MKGFDISDSQLLFRRSSSPNQILGDPPQNGIINKTKERQLSTVSYSLLHLPQPSSKQSLKLPQPLTHDHGMAPLKYPADAQYYRFKDFPVFSDDDAMCDENIPLFYFRDKMPKQSDQLLSGEVGMIETSVNTNSVFSKAADSQLTDNLIHNPDINKPLLHLKGIKNAPYEQPSVSNCIPCAKDNQHDKLPHKDQVNSFYRNLTILSPLSNKEMFTPDFYCANEHFKEIVKAIEDDIRILQDIFKNEMKIVRTVKYIETVLELYRDVQISLNHKVRTGLTICFKYNYENHSGSPVIFVKEEKGIGIEDFKAISHLVDNFEKRKDRGWTLAFEFLLRAMEVLEKITNVNFTSTFFHMRTKEEAQRALVREEQDVNEKALEIDKSPSKSGELPFSVLNEEVNKIKKQKINNILTINNQSIPTSPSVRHELSYEYLNSNEENFSRYRSDFEEIQVLGKGGFGAVFKVRNKLDGNYYAVKMIFFRTGHTQEPLKSVLQEVKLLSKLNHPNIVRYFQAWIEDGDLHEKELAEIIGENPDDSESAHSNGQNFSDDTLGQNNTIELHRISDSGANRKSLESNESEFDFSNRNFLKNCAKKDFMLNQNNDFNWKPVEDDFVVFEDESPKNEPGASPLNDSLREETSHGLVASLRTKQKKKDTTKFKALFIQMEFCENQTLKEHLHLYSLDTTERAIRNFLIQVIEALNYLHSQGFIHRDLKPSNIFLDQQKNIKLGDFGLAKQTGVSLEEGKQLHTKSYNPSWSFNIGTPIYMSPEQKKSGDYNNKTDMYSLGVVLFELLMPPFYTESERIKSTLDIVNTGVLPPALSAHANNELVKIMLKLIDNDPAKRPSSNDLYSAFQDSLYQEHIISNIAEYKKIIQYVFNKRKNFVKARESQTQAMNFSYRITGPKNHQSEAYFIQLVNSVFSKYFVSKVQASTLLPFEDQVNIISIRILKDNVLRSFKSLSNYIDINSFDPENLFIDKNAIFNYFPRFSLMPLLNSIKYADKEHYRCYCLPNLEYHTSKNGQDELENLSFVNCISGNKLSKEVIGYYQAEPIKIISNLLDTYLQRSIDIEIVVGSSYLFDMLFEKIKLSFKLLPLFFQHLKTFHSATKAEFLKGLVEILNLEYKKKELIYDFLCIKEANLGEFKHKLLRLFPNDPIIDLTIADLQTLDENIKLLNIKEFKLSYASYPPLQNFFPLIYAGYVFWIGTSAIKITTPRGSNKLAAKFEVHNTIQYETIGVGGRFDNLIARGSSYFDNDRFATGFILYRPSHIFRFPDTHHTGNYNTNFLSAKDHLQSAYILALASFSEPLVQEKLRIASDIWAFGFKVKIYFEEMLSFERLVKISKDQGLWLIVILKPGIFVQHNKIRIKLVQKDLERDLSYDDFKNLLHRKSTGFDDFIKSYTNDFNIIESEK